MTPIYIKPKRPDDGAGIVWTLVALSILLVIWLCALVAFAPMGVGP